MQEDKHEALNRLMSRLTGKEESTEPGRFAKWGSIFGGVETFSGNVVFIGNVSNDALEAILAKKTAKRPIDAN